MLEHEEFHQVVSDRMVEVLEAVERLAKVLEDQGENSCFKTEVLLLTNRDTHAPVLVTLISTETEKIEALLRLGQEAKILNGPDTEETYPVVGGGGHLN